MPEVVIGGRCLWWIDARSSKGEPTGSDSGDLRRQAKLAVAVGVVAMLLASACGPASDLDSGDSPETGSQELSAVSSGVAETAVGADGNAEPAESSDAAAPDGDGSADASVAESSGSVSDTTVESASPSEPTGAEPGASESAAPVEALVGISDDVPDLELIDVFTGGPVSLRSLVPSETPLLFWFWAPH